MASRTDITDRTRIVFKVDKKTAEKALANEKLQAKIKSLPQSPGVYIYYNDAHKVIYVGKAKRLKNRVTSYFVEGTDKGAKTEALVSNIVDIDTIFVRSEVEAFLLEAELIKRYKPRYNIDLKDDKSYQYLAIQDYDIVIDGKKYVMSRIFPTRTKKLKRTTYFGPFPDGGLVIKKALKAFRRVFPYCEYSKQKLKEHVTKGRACLYYHIGLCPGTCKSVDNFAVQQKNMRNLKQFLSKGYTKGIEDLQLKMKKYSDEMEFEKALEIRQLLDKIFALESSSILPEQYVQNPNLIEDVYIKRQHDIQELFGLEKLPFRIECYDISNIMGEWATGAMVVSEGGRIMKSEYRKFRIKYTKGITDFGMMTEVLRRRLRNDWTRPDILLIDGGKGQVGVVLKVVEGTEFETIPVIGIFKPNDFFIRRMNDKWKVTKAHKDNVGYLHLRELRDEAHRFVKGYHKKLRRELKTGEQSPSRVK